MILDEQIPEGQAKADYFAWREQLAALVHEANQLIIGVFESLAKQQPGGHPVHASAHLLARHAIEMADSVALLVGKGAGEPCKALLRSQLEASMGVLYILESDSDRRDLAYQLAHLHKQLKLYHKYDPQTDQGKTFAAEMADDQLWQSMKKPSVDYAKLRQILDSKLKLPQFVPIEEEWQKMKLPKPGRKKPDDPSWYALFGGPGNVRDLAERLKLKGAYETLYRYWSDTIHAGGALTQVRAADVGGTVQQVILPLRNPEHLQQCVSICITLLLKVGTAMVEKYTPDKVGEFSLRYVNGIREPLMSLVNSGPVLSLPWTK